MSTIDWILEKKQLNNNSNLIIMGLKFEFHRIGKKKAEAAYKKIEARGFESLEEAVREAMQALSIELGPKLEDTFDGSDEAIAADEGVVDELLGKWDREDIEGEETFEKKEVDPYIDYLNRIRTAVHGLLMITDGAPRVTAVFIALVRDETGRILGMIDGFFTKNAKVVDITHYLTEGDVGIKLHDEVEKGLKKLDIAEVFTSQGSVEDHPKVITLLRAMKYHQNVADDKLTLDITVPLDQRPEPTPYIDLDEDEI